MDSELWEQQPECRDEQPVSEVPADRYSQISDQSDRTRGSKKKGMRVIVAVIGAAVLAVSSACVTAGYINARWQDREQNLRAEFSDALYSLNDELQKLKNETPVAVVDPDSGEPADVLQPSQVYAMNVDAVVAISNQGLTTNYFGQVSETASSGSGFLISADGYVVSNYHVVEGASKLTVILADGREFDAQLVGFDAANDIAVLKIQGDDFPYVKLGSSDLLVVGDRVAAIGNPLGELTSTLTVGYVSAKDRNVNTDGTSMNMLQTDASINSGNSSGPLFNMYGQVVGITTAKYSGTSNSGATIEGIGFAIPIDDVSGMIDDIIEKGYVSGAYLGVVVENVTAEDSQKYGLPMGALVTEVSAGYAAERAGILMYDIIVELGGQKIASIDDLTRVLRDFGPGDETELKVYRSGAESVIKIVLDEKPRQTEAQVPQSTQPVQPDGEGYQSPYDGYDGFFWPFFG